MNKLSHKTNEVIRDALKAGVWESTETAAIIEMNGLLAENTALVEAAEKPIKCAVCGNDKEFLYVNQPKEKTK